MQEISVLTGSIWVVISVWALIHTLKRVYKGKEARQRDRQYRERIEAAQQADQPRYQESLEDEQKWFGTVGARKRAAFKQKQAEEHEEFERKLGREYEKDYQQRLEQGDGLEHQKRYEDAQKLIVNDWMDELKKSPPPPPKG